MGHHGAASRHGQSLPADTEERLAGFTELVATAIANAQARVELRGRRGAGSAAAGGDAGRPGGAAAAVFAAVTKEVGALFNADATGMLRFEPGGEAMLVGVVERPREAVRAGERAASWPPRPPLRGFRSRAAPRGSTRTTRWRKTSPPVSAPIVVK